MIKIKFLTRQLLYKKFFAIILFQAAQHFYKKREESGARSASGSGSVFGQTDPEANPGGPKT
jgi:hypothetical protein